jgi:hypothetical protein
MTNTMISAAIDVMTIKIATEVTTNNSLVHNDFSSLANGQNPSERRVANGLQDRGEPHVTNGLADSYESASHIHGDFLMAQNPPGPLRCDTFSRRGLLPPGRILGGIMSVQ